jgi:integrase
MAIYKRGGVYWIDYYIEGKRIREPVKGTRRDAQAILEARRTDVRRDEFHYILKKERLQFEDMVEEYRVLKADKRSLRRDETCFKNIVPEFRGKGLDQILPTDIEAYKEKRAEKVSGATVNRELALLRHLFSLAIEKGYVHRNPVKGVKFLRESPWRQGFVLSNQEIRALIAASAPHLREILAVAFETGLRKGDIFDLRWRDVDFDLHVIRVIMQKTREPLELPMRPVLENILVAKRGAAGECAGPDSFIF